MMAPQWLSRVIIVQLGCLEIRIRNKCQLPLLNSAGLPHAFKITCLWFHLIIIFMYSIWYLTCAFILLSSKIDQSHHTVTIWTTVQFALIHRHLAWSLVRPPPLNCHPCYRRDWPVIKTILLCCNAVHVMQVLSPLHKVPPWSSSATHLLLLLVLLVIVEIDLSIETSRRQWWRPPRDD